MTHTVLIRVSVQAKARLEAMAAPGQTIGGVVDELLHVNEKGVGPKRVVNKR